MVCSFYFKFPVVYKRLEFCSWKVTQRTLGLKGTLKTSLFNSGFIVEDQLGDITRCDLGHFFPKAIRFILTEHFGGVLFCLFRELKMSVLLYIANILCHSPPPNNLENTLQVIKELEIPQNDFLITSVLGSYQILFLQVYGRIIVYLSGF